MNKNNDMILFSQVIFLVSGSILLLASVIYGLVSITATWLLVIGTLASLSSIIEYLLKHYKSWVLLLSNFVQLFVGLFIVVGAFILPFFDIYFFNFEEDSLFGPVFLLLFVSVAVSLSVRLSRFINVELFD